MKIQKFKTYIFKRFTEKKIQLWSSILFSGVVSILLLVFSSTDQHQTTTPEELQINLNVLIPKGHVLYPFEAANFESVEPLLEAYNMVQVYNPENGDLIAKNIKILRAPKNPSHLAFLVPVDIANKLAPFGLNFKIAIQKRVNQKPLWVLKENDIKPKLYKTVTFGG